MAWLGELVYKNLDAKPASPPCDPACPLKYSFSAISPACCTTFSLLAPPATLPCAALESNSYNTQITLADQGIENGGLSSAVSAPC